MSRRDKSSPFKAFAFRLTPGQDLKKEIIAFAKKNKIKAGCMISAVGSVQQYHLRFANKKKGVLKKGYFEISGLVGTFSDKAAHLHLLISASDGTSSGGHLLEGTLIYTTAELIVGELIDLTFSREKDHASSFNELVVRPGIRK